MKRTKKEERNNNYIKNYRNNPQTINKIAISTYISIITLNVNELNAQIKQQRVAEWIQK